MAAPMGTTKRRLLPILFFHFLFFFPLFPTSPSTLFYSYTFLLPLTPSPTLFNSILRAFSFVLFLFSYRSSFSPFLFRFQCTGFQSTRFFFLTFHPSLLVMRQSQDIYLFIVSFINLHSNFLNYPNRRGKEL